MADEYSNDTTAGDADAASAGTGWTGDVSELSDIQRTLSALGTRIDALVTSTTSYRSAITDRLVEYTDTVSTLIRNQSGDVDEDRKASQRLLADLQQGVAASERTLTALGDRLQQLQASGGDDDSNRLLAELRSVLDAQEGLSRFLTDALDQFGDRVTKTLTTAHEASLDQLDGLKKIVDGVADTESKLAHDVREIVESIGGLREAMVDVASGEVVGALWDEVRSLRDSIGAGGAGGSDEVRADVARLAEAIDSLLDQAEVVGDDDLGAASGSIAALATEVARLRADFTEGLVVEPSGAMGETIDEIRADVANIAEQVQGLGEESGDSGLRADIEALTDAVRTLLEQAELVDEDGEPLDVGDDAEWADDQDGEDDAPSGSLATMRDLIESTKAEVTAITERLDEGLVLDLEPSPEQREMVEQIAALRSDMADRVSVDLAPVLERLEGIRDDVAHLAASASSTFDADAIDALRAEIQAVGTGGSSAPDLVESLREELVALRRRIKVRADADILSAEQLDIIAKAVADRLK